MCFKLAGRIDETRADYCVSVASCLMMAMSEEAVTYSQRGPTKTDHQSNDRQIGFPKPSIMRTTIKSRQMLVDLLLHSSRFPSGCFVLVSALEPFQDIRVGGGEVTFAGLLDSHNFMHDHSTRGEPSTLQIAS